MRTSFYVWRLHGGLAAGHLNWVLPDKEMEGFAPSGLRGNGYFACQVLM